MKTCPVCDTPYPAERTTCPTDGAVLIETHELNPGHIVRGKYKIVRKLGQGGMGVVYLAEHQMLGGQVALKFLAPELSRNPQFVKRFRNEARAAYQLRHPNIVEVADLDQDEDGSLFIAMEFVNGPSLRLLMREAKSPLPADRALGIARGVASGLAAAHARGSVHRDIKPENILLSLDAQRRIQAKVLDFGIATMTDNITDLSRTHGLLLTPEYASPEQWRGTPANELDGRTDLYALGCCLYEMLAGKTPYKAVNPEGWMYQHLNGTIEPLETLRPDLERDYPGLGAVLMNLLARDREQRTPSAMAFLEAVASFEPGAQAHYGQSANLPPMQAGTGAQASSMRPAVSQAHDLTGANMVSAESAIQSSKPESAAPSIKTPAESVAPVVPTGSGAPPQASPSSRRNLVPFIAGAVLAAVIVFAAAWFVFRRESAIQPAAEVPRLSPPGGQYDSPQTVTITDATPNAVIHYTLDGTPPTHESPIYTDPLDSLQNGATLRAMAIAPGHRQSRSVTGLYLWIKPPAPAPVPESKQPPKSPAPDVFAQGKSAFDHKQYVQARSFFEQSCGDGNMDGCNYFGYLLSQGLGGPAEIDKARSIFTKACDGGIVNSCISLGSLFQNSGDAANARKYFQIACDKGNSQACGLARNVQ